MTEAEKAAKKAAKKAEKKLQRANLAKLIVLITESAIVEEDETVYSEVTDVMVELALSLKKAPQTTGVTGIKAVIMGMFSEVGDTVDEDTIWTDNKLGRSEMRKATVNLIKKEVPEDRMWISFDPEAGVYTLEGIGADAPSGWTGYTPVKVEDIEIM